MKTGIYAYAVSEKDTVTEDFLRKARLESLYFKDLQLIYREVEVEKIQLQIQNASRDLHAMKKILEDHGKVVENLSLFGTVIPFRFGTVLKGINDGIKFLSLKSDFFKATLKKIKNKEEWGIRLYKSAKAEIPVTAKSGKDYLLKIREKQAGNHKAGEKIKLLTDKVIKEIKDMSAQVSAGNAGSYSFLIKREDREGFKDKISDFKKKYSLQGVDLIVSGPWPPYSFV